MPLARLGTAQVRASAMDQRHAHLFGDVAEDDRHRTLFGEASLSGRSGPTSWVGGVAVQSDSYRSQAFPAFDYAFTAPAAFVQVEHDVRSSLTLAASGRLDVHSAYGTQLSPRLSALYRSGPWRVRASVGRGFYAPTPFVDEVEEAGLSRLDPPAGLKAETARTGSVDLGYARGLVEARATLFGSDIARAVRIEAAGPERVRLANAPGTTRIRGSELLLRYRRGGYTVTGSYLLVDAGEPDPNGPGRRRVPLTPRHSGGLVAMWEDHDKGRVGIEAYYTGLQALEDDPYRTASRPYVHLGVLGEIVVGKARLFVNAENILGIRQTEYAPLLRPVRAPDGSWTVDVWAPTEGFTLNAGVRFRLGGGH
jgi:iron complex outermembrane receptor protein